MKGAIVVILAYFAAVALVAGYETFDTAECSECVLSDELQCDSGNRENAETCRDSVVCCRNGACECQKGDQCAAGYEQDRSKSCKKCCCNCFCGSNEECAPDQLHLHGPCEFEGTRYELCCNRTKCQCTEMTGNNQKCPAHKPIRGGHCTRCCECLLKKKN